MSKTEFFLIGIDHWLKNRSSDHGILQEDSNEVKSKIKTSGVYFDEQLAMTVKSTRLCIPRNIFLNYDAKLNIYFPKNSEQLLQQW